MKNVGLSRDRYGAFGWVLRYDRVDQNSSISLGNTADSTYIWLRFRAVHPGER